MNQNEIFIQESYPDRALNHAVQGEFLQSEEWRKFQESVGRKTYCITGDSFYASIIEHQLPIVGKYFYIPRGPIIENPKSEILDSKQIQNSKFEIQNSFSELINLAKENNAGWIRIEPAGDNILEIIKGCFRQRRTGLKIQKAPHDMQPREILVMDITKTEEELLAEMRPKTRYNIKLSQKHNASVKVITNNQRLTTNNYFEGFIRLVKITAKRDKITSHPESYYRKMFETIPPEILKLYVAEYENKIIAANVVIFYGNTAIYLHGASDYEYRNIMAPYLLHWQAILDAKKAGCKEYDLGGVKSCNMQHETCNNNWAGITRFKLGFAPKTAPIVFSGSYDIILNPKKYYLYRFLQKIKKIL